MLPNHAALFDAIPRRHSVRTFSSSPIPREHLARLEEACRLRPAFAGGARVALVAEGAERVFPGLVVKGAPACLVMFEDASAPRAMEAAGYLGEYAILTATALGLGTCWISGTYRPAEAARLAPQGPSERILAASPLGYPAGKSLVDRLFSAAAGSKKRKPLAELLTPASLPLDRAPAWASIALEAARLAPSAANRQPWRFTLRAEGITVSTSAPQEGRGSVTQRLDCGIAMLHLELGAASAGVDGRWVLLDPPDLALYEA